MCEPWEWTSQAVTSSQSPEAMEITAKINKCNLTKLTSFCTALETVKKQKEKQPTDWEKIFANTVIKKGLICKIHK